MDLRICLIAITALVLSAIVKQWKADFLPLLRLSIAVVFAVCILTAATPLVEYLKRMLDHSVAEYAELLLKALGIAILTQCCGDICKECGESGIANGVELVGKVEILLLSLPLINEILELAEELLSLGGHG